jgi:hypothetical protein
LFGRSESFSVIVGCEFWETYPNNTLLFSILEFPNMKYVFIIVALVSLNGLAGCQPSAGGNVVTSDMGGSDGGSGSGY